MKAWQIFSHSVRQVFGNLAAAIRISALPFVLSVVAAMAMGAVAVLSAAGHVGMRPGMAAGAILVVLLALLAYLALVTLIAVSWHRFVLLNEVPGWLPKVRMDRMLAYLGTGLLVALVLVAIYLVVGLVLWMIGAGRHPVLVGIVGVPMALVVISFAYRLSAALPGAALGQGDGLSGALAATRGQGWTMLALAVIVFLASLGVGLVVGVLAMIPVLGTLIYVAFQWLVMMVTLSIMTTLYGHYVQKRELT